MTPAVIVGPGADPEPTAGAGLPHFGPQRLGHTYSRAGYVVDDQADIVRELYARFSGGEGLSRRTSWLHAEGVTGARCKPWSRFGVSYYLESGSAAGFVQVHDPTFRSRRRGLARQMAATNA